MHLKPEKGLVIVNTGDGKGKSTAGFGLIVRALGNSQKVCIIQFIKSPDYSTGESNFFKNNGVEMHTMGVGFTIANSNEDNRVAIKKAWDLACEKIADSSYNLIMLDEINYVLDISNFDISDIINVTDVVNVLKNRSENQNIILTGRNAKQEIIEIADLVTEMKCIKHYYDNGFSATKGIEF